jgi:ATP-binding cassette subfamily F protein uup
MDEPTNDIDVETINLIEELLLEYSGTILLVSNDRDFLNNVLTSTLAIGTDGNVREYVGGYDDWLRQSSETAAQPSAAAPQAQAKPRRQAERARKLSFKEERELETLPDRIAAMEEEQENLHQTLADPEIYRTAGAEVANLKARLEALETELEEAYLRWEELDAIKG